MAKVGGLWEHGAVRWPKVIVWAVAAIAVLVVGWEVLREREPVYKGKTLSEWMEVAGRYNLAEADSKHVEIALERMGTNALPWMIKWIKYEEPEWRIDLYKLTGTLPISLKSSKFVVWLVYPKGRDRAWVVAKTFQFLGAEAVPGSLAGLSEILNGSASGENKYRAALALSSLGSPALPHMVTALSNPTNSQRAFIAVMIPRLHDLGTNGRSALPVLCECARSKDSVLAMAATTALGNLAIEPELVVPVLASGLTNSDYTACIAAARALSHFGPAAAKAVPALVRALDSDDASVRKAAEDAMRTIVPEELKWDKENRVHKAPTIFHPTN